MKIKFNDKDIDLKYSFRAMIMYENTVGETFTGAKGITETITFFYCILVTTCKDYTISFDDVLDWLDDNPNTLVDFGKWLVEIFNNQSSVKKNSRKSKKEIK